MATTPAESDFLAAIPKVELHVHVEGTIEPDLLFTIAERNGIELPYATADGLMSQQSATRASGTENLAGFLEALDISRGALRTASDYHDITTAFLRRCRDENTIYAEIMFDPQQAIRQGVPFDECVEALFDAQASGLADYGVESQWIMCFQRDHPANEALDLLDQADRHRHGITGVGLDNAEIDGFPQKFAAVFEAAGRKGYRLTSHCDVNQPNTLAHIRDCLGVLGVERLDHGLNAATDAHLLQQVVERRIPLTGCPTFYADQTSHAPDRIEMFRVLLKEGALISLNTDDPAQFGSGWMVNTLVALQSHGGFTTDEMVQFTRNAFESAWVTDEHRTRLIARLDAFLER